MRVTLNATTIGRIPISLRPLLPKSKKLWAAIVLGIPAFLLLVAGLGQIFSVDVVGTNATTDSEMPALEWRDMVDVLNRYGERPIAGGEQPELDVLFGTPQYFAATRRQPPALVADDSSLLFYVTEATHFDDLPASAPQPLLRINGAEQFAPAETVIMADSAHHRATVVRYSVTDIFGTATVVAGTTLEVVFPAPDGAETDANVLSWTLPLEYSSEYTSADVAVGGAAPTVATPGVTGVAVLAVLGGLLAAMWPCLFQLTAYFIPAMAGMSMSEASEVQGVKPRVGVVKTAFFFVLGFTIVYTLAGAIIGYGSQQLSNMDSFYIWQRYLSIGAGVILFGLAFRIAARARAPLVCKMPIASKMAHKGVTTKWESMLVGVTFATGCMTCFGSAVLIGMVLYVGLNGSALVGATLLFLFSIGMGVPLVFGAIAMAKVLPLLFKMEKVVPWMGLVSAILISGYAILLVTGNFMSFSGVMYSLLGMESPLG